MILVPLVLKAVRLLARCVWQCCYNIHIPLYPSLPSSPSPPPLLQDPDYTVEMDQDNPEFKKLAFTAPGPKNSFAPLKRRDYMDSGRRKDSTSNTEEENDHGRLMSVLYTTVTKHNFLRIIPR